MRNSRAEGVWLRFACKRGIAAVTTARPSPTLDPHDVSTGRAELSVARGGRAARGAGGGATGPRDVSRAPRRCHGCLAARFSPRLRRHRTIRRFIWEAAATYYTNAAVTRVENRAFDVAFATEFHNSDQTGLSVTKEYELLPQDFRIAPGVLVAKGGYQQRGLYAFYNLGSQRRAAGRFSTTMRRLYDGTRREASYSSRMAVRPRFTIEPGLSLAWVDLPAGEFAARLMTSRFTWTPTNRMFVSSLLQCNVDAHTTSSSVRWRWEYRLGSELFVVYSDGRDTLALPRTVTGSPIMNRTFAVKATRLFRF